MGAKRTTDLRVRLQLVRLTRYYAVAPTRHGVVALVVAAICLVSFLLWRRRSPLAVVPPPPAQALGQTGDLAATIAWHLTQVELTYGALTATAAGRTN